jgi:AraC-like DNA-binding protein
MASLIGPFLGQVADFLDEVDTRGLGVGVRLAGNVVDLLGTVLAERLDCVPDDPDTAHRALMVQITAFIEEHLGEADLAPAQIAAAHHVSLRQLHKLFHGSGMTVAGWIRQRRLEHCGHDLRDPRCATWSVATVGTRWGYPDPAHFSRLFKATYGVGPRAYRASHGRPSHRLAAPARTAATPAGPQATDAVILPDGPWCPPGRPF